MKSLREHLRAGVVGFTALLIMFGAWGAFGAAGDLDASFGNNGIVVTDVLGNASPDDARALALQPDGKILVAGTTNASFALVRYASDGTLDTSFGNNSVAVTPVTGNVDTGFAVAVQPDGKILVAGTSIVSNNEFALVRYNADGTLDTSFDGDGKVTTRIGTGSGAIAYAIALQADGKIVLVGYSTDSPLGADTDLALARYHVDGSLDSGFGGDGTVTTAVAPAGSSDVAYAVAVQPDGAIVVAGVNSALDFVVARYTAVGTLDSSFDGDGIVTTQLGGNESAWAIALQPDGKILVAGQAPTQAGPLGFAVVRYERDGSLDTTFDVTGDVVTALPGLANAQARALAVQPDGRILVGGFGINQAGDTDFALMRFNSDGSVDTGFGVNGLSTTRIDTAFDIAYALALQPDGAIVQAGWRQNPGDFVVLRVQGSPLDVTPDAFAFTDETGVGLNQVQTSNLVTVSGLEGTAAVPVSVTGGEYALNGSTSYTTGINWVRNGDQLNVRHSSAATEGTRTDTALTVGGVMAPNSVTHLGTGEVAFDTFSTTTAAATDTDGGGGSDGLGLAWPPLAVLAITAALHRRNRWRSSRKAHRRQQSR